MVTDFYEQSSFHYLLNPALLVLTILFDNTSLVAMQMNSSANTVDKKSRFCINVFNTISKMMRSKQAILSSRVLQSLTRLLPHMI